MSSLHLKEKTTVRNCYFESHLEKKKPGFVFLHLSLLSPCTNIPTFEPFMNRCCAAQHFRQLPFADSYEHFISLRSPGGVRVQFAFQNPSLCLTSNASLVLSQRHALLLLLPLTQVECHRLWWEEGMQWFGCYCAFKHLQVFQKAQRWISVNTSDKLATVGFIHSQHPL